MTDTKQTRFAPGPWKPVPATATQEMIDAWRIDQSQGRSLENSYRAMIAVAPTYSDALNPAVIEALEQCEQYFDTRADADCEGDPLEFVPNKEMRLLSVVREALALATGKEG